MKKEHLIEEFAPLFVPIEWSDEDRSLNAPFFTNLDQSVYAPIILLPEPIGALCSRSSRTKDDLRSIWLHESLYPRLNPERSPEDTEETWNEKLQSARDLRAFLEFVRQHSLLDVFHDKWARNFYVKWLAQYGDDSIAQMAGGHLVFWGISQVAIKFLEDQRIGLAPIEKSTRYVDYSQKVNGQYRYYTDQTFEDLWLADEYREVMDRLFDTYSRLIPLMIGWLDRRFPNEKESVKRAKAFDVLRGLLPASTLSQVAFFGNGQAFEYMINRAARHQLGELRWIAKRSKEELDCIMPAFLRRTEKPETRAYQEYLATLRERIRPSIEAHLKEDVMESLIKDLKPSSVELVEYDPEGETKVIAGLLYPETHLSWDEIFAKVQRMNDEEKREVLRHALEGRTARWQKVPRAFENDHMRFEIVINLGAYRDLHRHRMMTQQRQRFSCHLGYDVPEEIIEAQLEQDFRAALDPVEELFRKIERRDPELAQYATTLAHRIRFMMYLSHRQFFWMSELRTIPEGHPDYRHAMQEAFRQYRGAFPLLAEHCLVNMQEYDFARRGQEDRIERKEDELKKNG